MINAELIAKIKTEIEGWLREYAEDSQFELGEKYGYKRFISFLDTLESEKSMNQDGLDEEVHRFFEDCIEVYEVPLYGKVKEEVITADCYEITARHFAQWGAEHIRENEDVEFDSQIFGKVMSDILAVYKEPSNPEEEPFDYEWTIARQFYELGCRRTAEKYDRIEYNQQRVDESVPADLKEAAKNYEHNRVYQRELELYENYIESLDEDERAEKNPPSPNTEYILNADIIDAYIAGAKWDREKMMKEAVEIGTTEICWEQDGDRAFPTFDPPVEDLLMPGTISQRFEDGDKVRVIIFKQKD